MIDRGLEYLAATQSVTGAEGYWAYNNSGTLATTASVALAFVEEGYLPGEDVIFEATNYGDVVGRAVTYVLNRAKSATDVPVGYSPWVNYGEETAVYLRYAEDYNSDGVIDATDIAMGANDRAIWFDPGAYHRSVYTTGMVAPTIYALGEALGPDTVIGLGNLLVAPLTYEELMQDLVDWISWAQVEPDRGNFRGGWRYYPNQTSSDNSTAQWGALPLLYGQAWGLGTPQHVYNELALWVAYIQNPNGGSGYSTPNDYVNMSKTGGLLLEFAALGYEEGTHPQVDAALGFIADVTRWNAGPSGIWYGNMNHPYAMWGVYKGLRVYGKTVMNDNGTSSTLDDFLVGIDIAGAPGGFQIGQDWSPQASDPGDWYSHYCHFLCEQQQLDGSWPGYEYWYGPLATAWYINIINAQGALVMTPPEVLCPEAYVEECAAPDGTEVMVAIDVYDQDGDALTVTWNVDGVDVQVDFVPATDPPPTSAPLTMLYPYPLGDSMVTITVEDGITDPVFCETMVTIVDTTPPVVIATVASPMMWPPNHNLFDVGLTIEVTDLCDENAFVEVFVCGDEDDEEPTGDGCHSPDAKFDNGKMRLRSERMGNADGRVYMIVVSATDQSGNVGYGCCCVVVPKTPNNKGMQSVLEQAADAMGHCGADAPPPTFYIVGDGDVIGPKQ
ncbi:MAG: prenyltransferase/squalene oxidase repeat-containing protein [Planctomycetota bacterium]